jgi:hypothetical protein
MPNSSKKSKLYAGMGASFCLSACAVLAAWAAWRSARGLMVPSPAPLAVAITPASPAPQDWNFLGTWSGLWDGKFHAQFTITQSSGRQLMVLYQWQNRAGGPMFRRMFRIFPTANVLFMRFAGVTLTQPTMGSSTLQGIANMMVGDVRYCRTGIFTRESPADLSK